MNYGNTNRVSPYTAYGYHWKTRVPEPYPYKKKKNNTTWKIITIISLLVAIITILFLMCILIPECPLKGTCRTTTTTTTATTPITTISTKPSTGPETTTPLSPSGFAPFMPYGISDSTDFDDNQEAFVSYATDIKVIVNNSELTRPVNITGMVCFGIVSINGDVQVYLNTIPYLPPDTDNNQYYYHRRVDSDTELAGLSCLLNKATIIDAYVFTWYNIAADEKKDKLTTMQCTLAFDGVSVYVIRVYKEDILLWDYGDYSVFFFYDKMYNMNNDTTTLPGKRLINYLKESKDGEFENITPNLECGW